MKTVVQESANAGDVRCICQYGPQVMKFEPAPVIRPNLIDPLVTALSP